MLMCYDNREVLAKKCCLQLCWMFWALIGIINAKSIGKGHLNIFITSDLLNSFFLGLSKESLAGASRGVL